MVTLEVTRAPTGQFIVHVRASESCKMLISTYGRNSSHDIGALRVGLAARACRQAVPRIAPQGTPLILAQPANSRASNKS